MRRPTAKTTFIGPVNWVKRSRVVTSAHFYLLQGGAGMIKLEYPSIMEAKAARAQLLKNPHTHQVTSIKLLQAIQEALIEAFGATNHEE